jgi:hypothetical protein
MKKNHVYYYRYLPLVIKRGQLENFVIHGAVNQKSIYKLDILQLAGDFIAGKIIHKLVITNMFQIITPPLLGAFP